MQGPAIDTAVSRSESRGALPSGIGRGGEGTAREARVSRTRREVTLVSADDVEAMVSSSLGRSSLRAACVGLPTPPLGERC